MEWLDQKQNLIEEKLNCLGLNIDSIETQNFTSVCLVPDEVDSGIRKSFYGKYCDVHRIFNSVIVQEFTDETRLVCFINDDISEKKIPVIVDFFYRYYGLDNVLRGKMSQNDLVMIRDNHNIIPLREWVFDDFILRLKIDIHERLLMLWILSTYDLRKYST